MVAETLVESPVSDAQEDLSRLGNAPRGTVIVIHEDAYCKGSEQWYWLPIPALTCECLGWKHRKPGGSCFHHDAVKAHLRERHPCLLCDGYVITRLEFHEGKGYLLRAACASEECSYSRVL